MSENKFFADAQICQYFSLNHKFKKSELKAANTTHTETQDLTVIAVPLSNF